jgi:hypothetical protein
MVKSLKLTLEDDEVKFTPDGKVAIVDAIGALSNDDDPGFIWETLKAAHPEIRQYCQDFQYKHETISVTDSRGWEKIEAILFDYLIEQWQEAV